MHYRVSGSHSPRVSDDITVQWGEERWRERGREGKKSDVVLNTPQQQMMTRPSPMLCCVGFHSARAQIKTSRETKQQRPCPPLPDLPPISALLCVLSVLSAAAVFVCRLSACGHEGMWEARVCAGALGNVRSGERGKERKKERQRRMHEVK